MPFIETNGTQLYYEMNDFTKHWEKEKVPLLLIHGMGVDHTIWFRVVPVLACSYPTITVDCRGHGRSSKPAGGYKMENMAEDIRGLISYLKVDKVNIVGTSMGGMIAQQLAFLQPSTVNSLVLLGTFCKPPKEVNLEERLGFFAEVEDLEPFYRKMLRVIWPMVGEDILDFIIDLEVHNPRHVLVACNKITWTYSGCDAAQSITVPTLILAGEKDGSIPPYCVEELHSHILRSVFRVLPDVCHTPYLEKPEDFCQEILNFVGSL